MLFPCCITCCGESALQVYYFCTYYIGTPSSALCYAPAAPPPALSPCRPRRPAAPALQDGSLYIIKLNAAYMRDMVFQRVEDLGF